MAKIIIADTSCLISLNKIELLQVLKDLYGEVYVTSEIQKEFGEILPDWIRLKNPLESEQLVFLQSILDKGEATALALALQVDNALVIIDELKGRTIASSMGIRTTGTIGVLILAKDKKLIEDLIGIINKMILDGFRISKELYRYILENHGS